MGKEPIPQLAVITPFCAAQNTICLLCGKGMLLAQVQLGVHKDLQILFCQAAFQTVSPQAPAVPFWVQDFQLLLAELHEAPVGPFLQPDQVPLDDSMSSWWSHVHQHGVKRERESGAISLQYKQEKNSINLN